MLRSSVLVLMSVGMLAFAPAASACEPTTSNPEVDTCDLAGTGLGVDHACVYVDNDLCQPDCLISVWVYCESNGEPGLQRGDEVRDDTCGRQWGESDGCGGG